MRILRPSAERHLAHGQSLATKGVTEIDALLQRAVEQGTVPGVVAAIVASKNQLLYFNAFGLKDVAPEEADDNGLDLQDRIDDKAVTSAAIMLLEEQAKLPRRPGIEVPAGVQRSGGHRHLQCSRSSFTTRKASSESAYPPSALAHLRTGIQLFEYMVGPLQQKTGKQAEDLPLLYDPGTNGRTPAVPRFWDALWRRASGISLGSLPRRQLSSSLSA